MLKLSLIYYSFFPFLYSLAIYEVDNWFALLQIPRERAPRIDNIYYTTIYIILHNIILYIYIFFIHILNYYTSYNIYEKIEI